ncbi:MAG: acetyl-CoA carboxylase biotin carboxylase subunit [Legionellales bacterium]|nr:acetyl-CoA carboxylase biotin carboxylase subunit [Legionellales bacterium]
MSQSVLIANRGEIALRILKTCRQLGLKTIAVYSHADANLIHLRLADQTVCIGPGESINSYMSIPAIISAAEVTGADFIHPGYGFLSENADFAQQVEDSGFKLVGPSSEVIRLMGDKTNARKAMQKYGVPCVPGSDELYTSKDALEEGKKIGYPVLLKAAGGGGGKGMCLVNHPDEMEEAYKMTKKEAQSLFNNNKIYVEKYLANPRHIEFQILADTHGNVICLGERDCSIQRRHQKLIEEAPAFGLDSKKRQKMIEACINAAKKIGYVGLGTFEFLYDNGEFYFIEMNTRIQVEHPVTEMVTGIDCVEHQLRVALGEKLSLTQKDIKVQGHAIECRINAEDPSKMLPSPGLVTDYHCASGIGVRVDTHLYNGYRIPHYYDSLIAKVICKGDTRQQAIIRMQTALQEMIVEGPKTNLTLQHNILCDDRFQKEDISIHFLSEIPA